MIFRPNAVSLPLVLLLHADLYAAVEAVRRDLCALDIEGLRLVLQIGDFLRAALAGKHAVVEQQCLRIGIGCAGLFQAAVLLEHPDHIGGRFGIQRVFVRLGIIAQLIEPFAQRQHVGVSVADIQRMILRQLLFGVGEGNFIFDLRDGIAARTTGNSARTSPSVTGISSTGLTWRTSSASM